MKLTKLAASATALLTAVVLTACSGGGGASGDFPEGSTMAKLNSAQKITIGTKFDQPLFGLAGPDGKPEGFDVEIGKLIADKLGIPADKINWVETVSQNREPFIQNGQVDIVVATYTINDKRKEVIDLMIQEWLHASEGFVSVEDRPDIIFRPSHIRSGEQHLSPAPQPFDG